MTDRLDLHDRYRRQLEALLAEHVPDAEAWAYGSRVNGRSHPASDLDLVLRGPCLEPIPAGQLAQLEEAIEQSNIPILIQTHDWARLPASFHKEIEKQYVILHEPPSPRTPKRSRGITRGQACAADTTTRTLGDVAEITMGQSPPGSTVAASGEAPLLNGPTEFGPSHPVPTQFTSDGRKFANAGDILFCVRGSTTGRMNWADQPYAIGRGIASIRHRSEPSLQHLVRAVIEHELPKLLAQATGSTFPNVSAQHLAAIAWPNIEPQELRAISRVLGALDDKIELNRRMSMTLEEIAHALFKSWFIDFDPVHAKVEGRPSGLPPDFDALFPASFQPSELGQIPEGWTVGSLSDIIDQIRDTVEPRAWPSERFTHFSIPAFDSNQTPRHEYGRSIKSHKLVVQPDSILVSRLNPEIERVWLADVSNDQRAVCSTEYLVIRPTTSFSKGYIYCLARSKTFQDRLQSLVTGTSRSHQRVPSIAILSTVVSIPPAPTAIMFERHARPLLDQSLMGRRQADQLTDARNMLLPELVSGKLSASIT